MENSPEDDPLTEEDRTLEEENHSEKELIMPEVNKADIEGDQEDHHPSQDNKSENSHTQAAEDQEATKDCVVQNHSLEETTTSIEETEIVESSEKCIHASTTNTEDPTNTTHEKSTQPIDDKDSSRAADSQNTDQAEELNASNSAISADYNPPPPPTPLKELSDTTSQASLQSDKERSSSKMEVDKRTGQSQSSLEKEQMKVQAEEAPSQENLTTTVT